MYSHAHTCFQTSSAFLARNVQVEKSIFAD